MKESTPHQPAERWETTELTDLYNKLTSFGSLTRFERERAADLLQEQADRIDVLPNDRTEVLGDDKMSDWCRTCWGTGKIIDSKGNYTSTCPVCDGKGIDSCRRALGANDE